MARPTIKSLQGALERVEKDNARLKKELAAASPIKGMAEQLNGYRKELSQTVEKIEEFNQQCKNFICENDEVTDVIDEIDNYMHDLEGLLQTHGDSCRRYTENAD